LIIDALDGFPGVYTKYIMQTIGADGILALMNGKENRLARFASCIIFIDDQGEAHTFEGEESNQGTIANYRAEGTENSNLRSVFGIEHLQKMFTNCSKEEVIAWDSTPEKEYSMILFNQWLVKNYQKYS